MEHFTDDFYSLMSKLRFSRLEDKSVTELENKMVHSIMDIEQDVKCARLLKRKFEEF